MSRYYSKTSGEIPKKMYIQQNDGHDLMGPYFSKIRCSPEYNMIEYILDEETGDYLRNPPLKPREKGVKKKLNI